MLLLIDEIDRADDEFEAFLLEVLAENSGDDPRTRDEVTAATSLRWSCITSNRTREVHDALKRRCLYHWVDHPDLAREIAIVRETMPAVSASLATQVAHASRTLRSLDLLKPPGVAETLDWAAALTALGRTTLDVESAAATLGAVLKYREDADKLVQIGLDSLLAS